MNDTFEPQRLQNWITGTGGVLAGNLVYHLQFPGLQDHCCQFFLFCTLANHVATIAKTNYWADLRQLLLVRQGALHVSDYRLRRYSGFGVGHLSHSRQSARALGADRVCRDYWFDHWLLPVSGHGVWDRATGRDGAVSQDPPGLRGVVGPAGRGVFPIMYDL